MTVIICSVVLAHFLTNFSDLIAIEGMKTLFFYIVFVPPICIATYIFPITYFHNFNIERRRDKNIEFENDSAQILKLSFTSAPTISA